MQATDAPTEAPEEAPIRSAEIVAVGTELLLGEIVDTNGAWLAATLADRGVDVYWSVRVGDNLARVRDALEAALERSDLVVTSGGLGPTEDDLTREAIAAVAGQAPTVDPVLERELRARFERMDRSMPAANVKQAWTIPAAETLPNPRGTAPGWLVRLERGGRTRYVAALPGPPRELLRMVEHELLPRLPLPAGRLWTTTLKVGGVGESHVSERLAELTAGANPSVATYARADGVHVRIAAKGPDAEAAETLGRPVALEVAARLGEAVWGADDDDLASVVIEALRRSGRRLAVVERATGGGLAAALAAADERGSALIGAVVAWQVDAMDTLGPPAASLGGANAAEAAVGARAFFAADAAIAVGELRAMDDEGGGVSVDVAVRDAQGDVTDTVRLLERGGPWVRDRVVLRALDLLRRRLRDTR